MPQTMTSPSMPLDPATVFRAARGKRGLVLGLGIVLLSLGTAWFASSQLQPAPARTPAETAGSGLDRAALAKLDLSTFQRRGNLLVGQITTPAGVRLRLVMDANTRALVGLRVVETEAGTAP